MAVRNTLRVLVSQSDIAQIATNKTDIAGTSSVDNESFRADQLYMHRINKSGGTLLKGMVVINDTGTTTGVILAINTTSKRSLGVVVDDTVAADATVKICYAGLAQVLILDGQSVSRSGFIEASPTGGKCRPASGYSGSFAIALDAAAPSGDDALVNAVMISAESG